MNKRFLLLITIPLLLTSCGYHGEHLLLRNADISLCGQKNMFVQINEEQDLINLASSKDSYAIYYGLEGCSNCDRAKSYLAKYIKDNKQLIYYVDMSYFRLEHYFSDENTEFSISNLYLFDNGQLLKKIPYDALQSSIMIKNNLSKTYVDRNVYVFNDSDNFVDYLWDHKGTALIANRNDSRYLSMLGSLKDVYIYYMDTSEDDTPIYSTFKISSTINYLYFDFDYGIFNFK